MSPEETTHLLPTRSISFLPKCFSPLIFIFIDSIKLIFILNPKLFFFIYFSAALPLSLSVASLSLSTASRRLKSHIRRLDYLFYIVDIWVEAGNVRETSQLDLKLLYRVKLLHFVPILIFSLFTVVATVTAVTSPYKRKIRPNFRAVVSGLRARWAGPVVTCVVCAFFWVVWGHVTTAVGHPAAVVATAVVEVYVMAVFGVALVVSVAEERAGVDAVWAGSGLMKGRRAVGWVMSGLILMGTNCIGREMVGVLDGGEWGGVNGGYKWTVEMRGGYMIGLMLLLGWVVMWGYVVITVYYCECRKRQGVIRQDEEESLDGEFEI